MEPIVTYLEDAEKKLMNEMTELFSKMREQRDTMSLQGIEDMYSSKPLEGVLYEPCLRIPCTHAFVKSHPITLYYGSNYKLPEGEWVVYVKETFHQWQNGQSWGNPTHHCIALTNYGRFIRLQDISKDNFPGSFSHGQYFEYLPPENSKIIKLEPLQYKLPSWFLQSFILHDVMYADPNSQNSISFPGPGHSRTQPNTLTESLNNTTNTIQQINKEFHLFAGKWKPHMTQKATLDIDTMRKTIIENTSSIDDLKEKNTTLEQQNAILQTELKKLQEEKAILEKEKASLLPLKNYKEAVLEFMKEHSCTHTNGIIDSTIIESFKTFHSNKVFVDEWVYNDVIQSKEELNEYRIYKKVKGEMVSSGMDNSNIARNVRSIKKSVSNMEL